jgi:hypothetical protein
MLCVNHLREKPLPHSRQFGTLLATRARRGRRIPVPRCADRLYRRAAKVSMGAVFAIPYARMTAWYHGLSSRWLHEAEAVRSNDLDFMPA